MANLHCECQELKPKGETNSSFLLLHRSSGVHTVKTVGSHLNSFCFIFVSNMASGHISEHTLLLSVCRALCLILRAKMENLAGLNVF